MQTDTNIDPLDIAGGDIDTSFPTLKDGKYRMSVKSSERVVIKGDEELDDNDPAKRFQAKIVLTTTQTEHSTDGQELPEGYSVTTYCPLMAWSDGVKETTIQNVKKGIGSVLQAAFGSKTNIKLSEFRNDPTIIVDRVVDVKIGHGKPTAEYPNPSNKVSAWVPAENS